VLILQGQTTAITGLPIDESQFKTENKITEQFILDLLAHSTSKASQKKEKKKPKQEDEKPKAEGDKP